MLAIKKLYRIDVTIVDFDGINPFQEYPVGKHDIGLNPGFMRIIHFKNRW